MSEIDIITVRWDAERDVYKVNRPNWSGGEVVLWSAVKTMLASQAAEVARLTKENDWLRAYTGQSAKACVYCGLGADEMGKCERGFPGCARADDQMLCREVGVAIERDALLARVEAAEKDAARAREFLLAFINGGANQDFRLWARELYAAMREGGK